MVQSKSIVNVNCDMRNYLFTSESVTTGHPDKVADRISDSILDAMLAQDPLSRVACETLVKNDMVVMPARSPRRPTSTSPRWRGRRSGKSATTIRSWDSIMTTVP